MANVCFFYAEVHGMKKDVLRFKNEIMKPNLIYRTRVQNGVWVKDIDEDFIQYEEDEYVLLKMEGECDWSISSSMGEDVPSDFETKSLLTLSKEYNLIIDAYSDEWGLEFQEHYVWYRGELIYNQCLDSVEYENEHTGEVIRAGGFEEFGETFLEFRDMTKEECLLRIRVYDENAVRFACERASDYYEDLMEEYEG